MSSTSPSSKATERARRIRYMRIGSSIGITVAGILELAYLAISGLFLAIFAMVGIPLIGEIADILALIVGLGLAMIGFYLGMLIGYLFFLATRR